MQKYLLLLFLYIIVVNGQGTESDPCTQGKGDLYLAGCQICVNNICSKCDTLSRNFQTTYTDKCTCLAKYTLYKPKADVSEQLLKCTKCPDYCSDCSQSELGSETNNCADTGCNSGFTLNATKACTCSEGSFITKDTPAAGDQGPAQGKCESCKTTLTNCLACSDGSTCTSCEKGYYLEGGKCVQCTSKIAGCTACTDASTCTECSTGGNFILESGTCKCITDYYLTDTKTCRDCSLDLTNCKVCSDKSTCTTCKPSYFLDTAGACSSCTSISHCTADCVSGTDKKGFCNACLESFTKTDDGKCVCNGNSYIANGKCVACSSSSAYTDKCLTCTDTACLTCSAGYFVKDGKCTLCSSAIPGCSACSSATICTTCVDGTDKVTSGESTTCGCKVTTKYLDTTNSEAAVCKDCPANCATCHENPVKKGEALCDTCTVATDYFIDSNKQCVACNTALDGCLKCSSNSVCSQCDTANSWVLEDSSKHCVCPEGRFHDTVKKVCASCSDNCKVCAENSDSKGSSKCSACADKYALQSNVCVACSTIPGCVSCTDNAGTLKCGTCSADFDLSGDKCVCKKGTFLKDGACSKCSDSITSCSECTADKGVPTCTACVDKHFLNTDTKACDPCSKIAGCSTCAPSAPTAGKCLTCTSTFAGVNTDGTCYCSKGFFKNTVANVCEECTSPCTECIEDSKTPGSKVCQACKDLFYLKDSKCEGCGNCANCHYDTAKTAVVCDTCKNEPGWNPTPKDGKCICTAGNYFDGSKCNACVSNIPDCETCDPHPTRPTDAVCTKCKDSTFIDDAKKCAACSSKIDGCAKCTSSSVCTQCKAEWNQTVTAQGKCDCNQGSFHNTKDKICQECTSGCSKCAESASNPGVSECQTCLPGWTVHDKDKTCTKCSGNCKTCSEIIGSGKEVCTVCNQGYGLDEIKTCQSCADVGKIANCDTCAKAADNTWSCSACSAGFNLDGKLCKSCQELTKDPNCDTCSNTGGYKCTKCKATFFLNSVSGKCEACGEGCKTCASSTQCNECSGDLKYMFSYPEKANCTKCEKPEEKKGVFNGRDDKGTMTPTDVCTPATKINDVAFTNATLDNVTNRFVVSLKDACVYSKPVGGKLFYIVNTGDALPDAKSKDLINVVRAQLKGALNLSDYEALTNATSLSFTDVIGGLIYGWTAELTTAGSLSANISVPTGASNIYYICSSKYNVPSDSFKTLKVSNVGVAPKAVKLVLSFNRTLNESERNLATCAVANILKVDKARVKNSQGRVCNDTPAAPVNPKFRVFMRRLAEAGIEIFTIAPNAFEANDTTLASIQSTLPTFQTQFQKTITFASIDKPQAVRDSAANITVPKWRIAHPGVKRNLTSFVVSVNLSTDSQAIVYYGWTLNTTNVTIESLRKGTDSNGTALFSSSNTVFDSNVEYQLDSPKLQSNTSYRLWYYARALADETKITNLSAVAFNTFDLIDIQWGFNMSNPKEAPKVSVSDDTVCSVELKLNQSGMIYVGFANTTQDVDFESLLIGEDELGVKLLSSENRNASARESYTFRSKKLSPKTNYTVYYAAGPLSNETEVYDPTPLYSAICTTGGNSFSAVLGVFMSVVTLFLAMLLL